MDNPEFGREHSASAPSGDGPPRPAITQDQLWLVLLRVRGEAAAQEDQRSDASSHHTSSSGQSSYDITAATEEDTEHFEEDEGEDDEGHDFEDHDFEDHDFEDHDFEDHDFEGIEGDDIEQEELDEEEEFLNDEAAFDASLVGLKEISNLASFTVSSYKPGCGVKELRDDDVNHYWQSDGPQPHRLNIHFIKRVEIRKLRLYLDYELDESYTPTKIQITAGFSPNMTIPYVMMEFNQPKGWADVPIEGAGGGHDGNSLCCWFVRVIVLENHQNGKDTHIRGVEVYALDDSADTAENNPVEDMVEAIDDYRDRMAAMNIHDHDEEAISKLAADKRERKAKSRKYTPGDGGLSIPDFMREPEIR
ncbi:APC10-domain-containing protein [Daldinia caldariorum]|uniref:APC10-domain-containing protein n=1 Tax=Daldinia caldariorum TaxID=326644 RepID=UPI002008C2D7|nr:APC10-domain-containing protein [Daldinia caldariorum]KAI1471720.1 APC10-domain-containing protein [Daldinia caldariorum]